MRAGMIIYNPQTDKVLLIHRWKKEREYFVIPGGTIETGEAPLAAALREIQEELGYCLTVQQVQPAFVFSDCGREEHYFLVRLTDTEAPAISGEEKERSHAANIYLPQWVDRKTLPLLPLQPPPLQARLQDFLDQQGLKN